MKKSHLLIATGLLFGATACRENEPIKPVNFMTPSASDGVVPTHGFDNNSVSDYVNGSESVKTNNPVYKNQEHQGQVLAGLPDELERQP